jgi:phage tail sheath gpL-like
MIPTTLRVPMMAVEFNSARASSGSAVLNYKAVIFGNKVSAGAMANATLTKCASYSEARRLAGDGSVLERIAERWFGVNRLNEVYLYSFDDAALTAATGTIAISGSPTAAGTLAVYVGGRRYALTVTTSSTPTTLGDALVAAMAADSRCPVTGVNTTGSVALTAKNKGIVGGETITAVKYPTIDVRVNYYDTDSTPAGLTVAVTVIAGGVGAPDGTAWGTAFDALGTEWFQVMIGPWFDSTGIGAIETELAARLAYDQMRDAIYVTCKPDSKANLQTFGAARNSPSVAVIGTYKPCGISWEWAGAFGGIIAREGTADPAMPFQTLELTGLLPPVRADRFDPITDNNALLYDGITTYTVDDAGVCRLQRAITTYQKNGAGADDTAYLDLNTPLTLMYWRYSFRTWIQLKYPRAKLVDDATKVASGRSVIDPKIGKTEAVAWARDMESKGLLENADTFAKEVTCVRSTVDPNRLEWMLPGDLANQFVVGAAEIAFKL